MKNEFFPQIFDRMNEKLINWFKKSFEWSIRIIFGKMQRKFQLNRFSISSAQDVEEEQQQQKREDTDGHSEYPIVGTLFRFLFNK